MKSHQIQSGASLIPYIHSSIALIHSKSIALTFVEIKAIYTQPKGVAKSVWFILKKRCALTQSVTPKGLEDHRIQVGDHRIISVVKKNNIELSEEHSLGVTCITVKIYNHATPSWSKIETVYNKEGICGYNKEQVDQIRLCQETFIWACTVLKKRKRKKTCLWANETNNILYRNY